MNGNYVWDGKKVDRKDWWKQCLTQAANDPSDETLKDLLMYLDLDSEVGESRYNLTPEEKEAKCDLIRLAITQDDQVALANLGVTLEINQPSLKKLEDQEEPSVTVWDVTQNARDALGTLAQKFPALQ